MGDLSCVGVFGFGGGNRLRVAVGYVENGVRSVFDRAFRFQLLYHVKKELTKGKIPWYNALQTKGLRREKCASTSIFYLIWMAR